MDSLIDPTSLLKERDFQADIIQFAEDAGWIVWYTHQSGPGRGLGRHSPPGEPDLRLVRPPRVLFVELKGPKTRLTLPQEGAQGHLGQCPGVEVYLWRPSDWDEIVRTLERTASNG